jgi:hypothetical protein
MLSVTSYQIVLLSSSSGQTNIDLHITGGVFFAASIIWYPLFRLSSVWVLDHKNEGTEMRGRRCRIAEGMCTLRGMLKMAATSNENRGGYLECPSIHPSLRHPLPTLAEIASPRLQWVRRYHLFLFRNWSWEFCFSHITRIRPPGLGFAPSKTDAYFGFRVN